MQLPSIWLAPHLCGSSFMRLSPWRLVPASIMIPWPRCFWPPLRSWPLCWEPHSLLWLRPYSRPPPQAVLHLILVSGLQEQLPTQFQPHPLSVLHGATGFCCVLFPPWVPPLPSSCHFERKSHALGLNKTNKLTNTLKSQVWVKKQSKAKLNSGEHFFCYRIRAFYSQPPNGKRVRCHRHRRSLTPKKSCRGGGWGVGSHNAYTQKSPPLPGELVAYTFKTFYTSAVNKHILLDTSHFMVFFFNI